MIIHFSRTYGNNATLNQAVLIKKLLKEPRKNIPSTLNDITNEFIMNNLSKVEADNLIRSLKSGEIINII